MAIGFPTKANWAAGDVLTASQMDDLAGTLNTVQYLKPWNTVLNSNMSIWQRGTTFTNPSNGYTADRWLGSAAPAGVITRQITGDTTNLPNIQYCMRYQRTAGQTSTAALNINQSFETVNSIPLAGKTVTLSFYARAGANYSAASSALNVQLLTGTGTDQNGYTSIYTGNIAAITSTATLTTTWQRFTYTATLSSSLTELCITIGYVPVGTAGAADYFDITGVQLEQGSVANTYQPNQATYEAELAACQRYYYRNQTLTYNISYGLGQAYSTTQMFAIVPFPVSMRTQPTSVEQTGTAGDYRVTTSAFGAINCSSIVSFNSASTSQATVVATVAAGLIAGNATALQSTNAGYLGFGAEL